ncbi:MerR family DNA-binding transcriptional regulator [Pseudomonas aeruginosa]|uniref:MerR family DNA-binding transcriptional regulator n=1 Tax=Pseudomonas aeruginosa TaxID=287 RepID=UPI00289CC635|nr:MerR family DNA-binding transcriptional regulator [Pseudomonas aeruginosa]
MAVALVQHQGRGLSFELGGKRTSLLAHQTPLSRRGFSPKSVSGISRPLHGPMCIGKIAEGSGVTAKCICHYENIGLLLPPLRRQGRYRV